MAAFETPRGIQMWHGAMRWEPPFEVRAPKGVQAEHGAGLYLCCHRLTATKYAKGGGNLVHAVVDPKVRWLERISVPADVLLGAARRIPRLRQRHNIMSDIERAGLRRDGTLGLNVLANLAVNYGSMVGQPAVDITMFIRLRQETPSKRAGGRQGAQRREPNRLVGEEWRRAWRPARRAFALAPLELGDRLTA